LRQRETRRKKALKARHVKALGKQDEVRGVAQPRVKDKITTPALALDL
jgi:hypothetical protein